MLGGLWDGREADGILRRSVSSVSRGSCLDADRLAATKEEVEGQSPWRCFRGRSHPTSLRHSDRHAAHAAPPQNEAFSLPACVCLPVFSGGSLGQFCPGRVPRGRTRDVHLTTPRSRRVRALPVGVRPLVTVALLILADTESGVLDLEMKSASWQRSESEGGLSPAAPPLTRSQVRSPAEPRQ
eukprot:749193-Hanusia_phi.AAC.1